MSSSKSTCLPIQTSSVSHRVASDFSAVSLAFVSARTLLTAENCSVKN